MKNRIIFSLLVLILVNLASCQSITKQKEKLKTDSKQSVLKDSIKVTFNETDLPVNDYLTDELEPIRESFKRINTIQKWTNIKEFDLWETLEGGIAKLYYKDGILEKIITRNFGETFQTLTEYYIENRNLSFVFQKTYKYNRPMYYDKVAMKENNDNEYFEFGKSEIIEDRSYFKNNKLIHQLNNQDCGSPFAQDYLKEEENRILTEYKLLKELEEK